MTEAQAAVGMDRLPWLTDEPSQGAASKTRRASPSAGHSRIFTFAGWAVAGALLLAGGSYWLGTVSGDRQEAQRPEVTSPATPESTVMLPEPREAVAPPVSMPAVPEVRPAPAPTIRISEPKVHRPSAPRQAQAVSKTSPATTEDKTVETEAAAAASEKGTEKDAAAKTTSSSASASQAIREKPLTRWPSRETKGASGRLVQIGAFGSRQQAKLGWRKMQKAYPAVGKLPAVVVEARNSRGRHFYRFQIGTTSQAHSEVLCQRMERIDYSCAVVGLPWKAKVER